MSLKRGCSVLRRVSDSLVKGLFWAVFLVRGGGAGYTALVGGREGEASRERRAVKDAGVEYFQSVHMQSQC